MTEFQDGVQEYLLMVESENGHSSDAKIEVRGLMKVSDKDLILSKVNVDIPKGVIFGVIGPSGSGKSTFLRALNRLWEPAAGSVFLDGVDIRELDVLNLRLKVGMLFQLPVMFEGTVADNIRYGPNLKGRKLSDNEVYKLMALADLDSSFFHKAGGELSVGQAQRVALARTLANEPEVLLLDEPTSALDPVSTQNIEDVLVKLKTDRGMTIIIVSHSIKQIQRIADTVCLLVNGEIVEILEPALLSEAKHPMAQKFLQLYLAMPTDMVGCIRRSLELSQSTLSSSSSYNSSRGSRVKLKQKKLYAASDIDSDSCSEESDEAESRHMGENSFLSPSKFGDAGTNSLLENSDKVHSAFEQSIKGQTVPESDIKCQNKDNSKHSFSESSSLSDSVKAFYPQNFENDHQLDKMSSNDILSQENIRHSRRNDTVDASRTNFTIENDDSEVGDSSCINGGESNYISDYLAFSDLMVHATKGRNPAFLDGENNMFDFFLNAVSQGLTSDKASFQNRYGNKISDDEEMEVSSTTSMSSVLGRMLNLEFDDQFDADESVYSLGSMEHEANKECKESLVRSETKKPDTFETPLRVGAFNCKEVQSEADNEAQLKW